MAGARGGTYLSAPWLVAAQVSEPSPESRSPAALLPAHTSPACWVQVLTANYSLPPSGSEPLVTIEACHIWGCRHQ